MTRRFKIKSVFILLFFLNFGCAALAQTTYKVKETKDVDVKLLGTSTLHDWEMNAKSTTGEAQFIFKSGSETDLVAIKSLSFVLLVKDLKSDNEGLNKNAYDALKTKEHKEIRYQLISSTLSIEKEGYLIKSKGNLTIAGVTKEITMNVLCVMNDDGTIASKGLYQLNMTDYLVNPPSFMWGAMKTGNALTLEFNVVYEKV